VNSLWGILVPYPLVAGLLLWRGWRAVPEPFLEAWAKRFAVPLDDVTRPYVAHRIGIARRIRTTAAALTLLVPGIPLYLSAVDADDPARWNGTWLWIPFIIGAPLAVLLSEALVHQRLVRRAATLERRTVGHDVEPAPLRAVFVPVASLGQGFSGLAASRSSWFQLPNLLVYVTYGYWWALTRDTRWDARLARRRLAQHA
jgi:hypothetical protein